MLTFSQNVEVSQVTGDNQKPPRRFSKFGFWVPQENPLTDNTGMSTLELIKSVNLSIVSCLDEKMFISFISLFDYYWFC